MTVSKPMKLIALRLDEDEKRHLARLAAEQHITLSHALREGAKLYLSELRERTDRTTRDRVAAS